MDLFVDFGITTGIILSIIIILFLLKAENKQLPKKILIVVFGLFLTVLICLYGYFHDIPALFLPSFIFEDSINMSIGPLLYLYVKSLFEKKSDFFKRNFKHLIIVVFYILIVSIPSLISIINENYNIIYLTEKISSPINLNVIFSIIYACLAFFYLLKSNKNIKDVYSSIEDKDIVWVKHFLIGSIIIMSVDLSTTLYELLFGGLAWETGYITIILMVFLIGYLGYYGLTQSKILLPNFIINEEDKNKSNYFSNLEETEIERVINEVKNTLEKNKLFLDENLTLNSLAELTSLSNKKLSTLLNKYMNISFYDLINNYRIAEFKARINKDENKNLTIIAIAFDSGFKSKSSFNRVFKAYEGVSPSEYIKSLTA